MLYNRKRKKEIEERKMQAVVDSGGVSARKTVEAEKL